MTNKQQIWLERKAFLVDFCKSGVYGFILIFIALGVFVATSIFIHGWNDRLSRKDAELNDLSAELTRMVVRVQNMDQKQTTIISGFDAERKARDDEIALAWVKNLTTWNSYSEYANARATATAGLSSTDMAPVLNTDIFGPYFNFIESYVYFDGYVHAMDKNFDDAMISEEFTSMETYFRLSRNNTCMYYAIVEFTRDFEAERAGISSHGPIKILLRYSVSNSGQLTPLYAVHVQ